MPSMVLGTKHGQEGLVDSGPRASEATQCPRAEGRVSSHWKNHGNLENEKFVEIDPGIRLETLRRPKGIGYLTVLGCMVKHLLL